MLFLRVPGTLRTTPSGNARTADCTCNSGALSADLRGKHPQRRVPMKANHLFVCCALALARAASGQAFGESVQLSQPALHSTGAATAVPTSPLSRSGLPQQSGVTVIINAYRGQGDCRCAKPPMFLPRPTEVAAGTVVILPGPNPDAVIYYTADGWPPTATSPKYE